MKILVESTSKIVQLNGVPARIWEGQTESGIPVHCFVTRIGVANTEDPTWFNEELQQHKPPTAEIEAYPMRMLI